MKNFPLLSFLLLLIHFVLHGQENQYIVVGQNENEATPAFVMELSENYEKNIYISPEGEVYIKADKIFVLPKQDLSQSACSQEMDALLQCGKDAKKWQCPYCNFWWEYGKKCTNRKCPKNQWSKKKR